MTNSLLLLIDSDGKDFDIFYKHGDSFPDNWGAFVANVIKEEGGDFEEVAAVIESDDAHGHSPEAQMDATKYLKDILRSRGGDAIYYYVADMQSKKLYVTTNWNVFEHILQDIQGMEFYGDFGPLYGVDFDVVAPEVIEARVSEESDLDNPVGDEDEQQYGVAGPRRTVLVTPETEKKIYEILNTPTSKPDMVFDTLFDLVVPRSGTSETEFGEIVRAMCRISYRWYNDGDKWFSGYGKETAGPSMQYLERNIPGVKALTDKYLSRSSMYSSSAYKRFIDGTLAKHVLEYLKKNAEDLLSTRNTKDSR